MTMDLEAAVLNLHKVSVGCEMDKSEEHVSVQRQTPDKYQPENGWINLDNPVFSIISDSSFDRVVRRSEHLEQYSHSLKSEFPEEVERLLKYYHEIAAGIEMDKLDAVCSNLEPQQRKTMNTRYNHQSNLLITVIMKRLSRLKGNEAKHIESIEKNPTAIFIMQSWFNINRYNPFPSQQEIQDLAKIGNITEDDVNGWFDFERKRLFKRIRQELRKMKKSEAKSLYGQ